MPQVNSIVDFGIRGFRPNVERLLIYAEKNGGVQRHWLIILFSHFPDSIKAGDQYHTNESGRYRVGRRLGTRRAGRSERDSSSSGDEF